MKIHLRKALPEDCDLLFRWANDPLVRQNSFNSENIPYEDHLRWFDEKQKTPEKCLFFIAEADGEARGQMRLDLTKKDHWLFSFSVAPNHRGKGIGKAMLLQLLADLKEISQKENAPFYLSARVKKNNPSSSKIFLSTGFKLNESAARDFYLYELTVSKAL